MREGLFITWRPEYAHPLPPGHRFPMIKYELLPAQLLREGLVNAETIIEPEEAELEVCLGTHRSEYISRLEKGEISKTEARAMGFPFSPSLWKRELLITGGTLRAAELATETGIAFNTAGGTHHAGPAKGEGFCILNDMAITANHLIRSGMARKILFIDLDVHQGNGSAEIFEGREDVFTLSFHGEKNYPVKRPKSHLDVELSDGTGDEEYLGRMKEVIPGLIESFRPDFIFYQAGVDVLASDKLGRLALTREGCRQRDELVLTWCHKRRIPVTVTMGGGYSEDIRDIVEAHMNTYRTAARIYL